MTFKKLHIALMLVMLVGQFSYAQASPDAKNDAKKNEIVDQKVLEKIVFEAGKASLQQFAQTASKLKSAEKIFEESGLYMIQDYSWVMSQIKGQTFPAVWAEGDGLRMAGGHKDILIEATAQVGVIKINGKNFKVDISEGFKHLSEQLKRHFESQKQASFTDLFLSQAQASLRSEFIYNITIGMPIFAGIFGGGGALMGCATNVIVGQDDSPNSNCLKGGAVGAAVGGGFGVAWNTAVGTVLTLVDLVSAAKATGLVKVGMGPISIGVATVNALRDNAVQIECGQHGFVAYQVVDGKVESHKPQNLLYFYDRAEKTIYQGQNHLKIVGDDLAVAIKARASQANLKFSPEQSNLLASRIRGDINFFEKTCQENPGKQFRVGRTQLQKIDSKIENLGARQKGAQ